MHRQLVIFGLLSSRYVLVSLHRPIIIALYLGTMEWRAGSGEGERDSDCGDSDRRGEGMPEELREGLDGGTGERLEGVDGGTGERLEGVDGGTGELREGVDGGTGELGIWARSVGGAVNSRSGLGSEAKIGFGQEWL